MDDSLSYRKLCPDLPDFVIAGAMKCASNTLHRALRQHPDIYMPARGMVFFAIDDIEEHPDFFPRTAGGWYSKSYEDHFQEYLSWYRSYYADARPEQLLGEAAPTYLASTKVAPRMARLIPDVKLIFLLRDPVARAYSQYWHEVYNGRVYHSFEDTIRFNQGTIVRRSLYKRQLQCFMDFFPKENMKFLLFEQFVRDIESTVEEVLDFLGVKVPLDLKKESHHKNKTNIRRFHQIHLFKNRLLKHQVPWRYYDFLPGMPSVPKLSFQQKVLLSIYSRINPCMDRKAPPMDPDTRRFLSEYYARENEGLAELIDLDLANHWPSLKRKTPEGSMMPVGEGAGVVIHP